MEADAESYVFRPADEILHDAVLAGEFCYVLTPRQMGKSSLLVRTRERLIAGGRRVASLDLTTVGAQQGSNTDAGQWYFALALLIHEELGLSFPLRPWWKEQEDVPALLRLTQFFRRAAEDLPCRAAIFLDEIETVARLPFSDDFFAAIRACYNERANKPVLKNITFVFAGVTTPPQLIRDPKRTPFNIGRPIELADFTLEQAMPLARLLDADPARQRALIERVLYWTDGHPYLTQMVCRNLGLGNGGGLSEVDVDRCVEKLFLLPGKEQSETNLKVTGDRLKSARSGARRLYQKVLRGAQVPDQPAEPLYAELKLTGAVKVDDRGTLRIRNRVYERVFSPEWVKPHLKQPAWKTASVAASVLLALGVAGWSLKSKAVVDRQAAALWETTATQQLAQGNRDAALLAWIEAARAEDTQQRRREIQHLIGPDYQNLVTTVRSGPFVDDVAFTPDGKSIAVGTSSSRFGLWSTVNGSSFQNWPEHPGDVSKIAVSSRGNMMATAGSRGEARLWGLSDGRPIGAPMRHPGMVRSLAFNSDGKILASGCDDGVVRLWDASNGRALGREMRPLSRIDSLAFSPDGKTLLIGADREIRMWRVADGLAMGVLPSSVRGISALAYSPDGSAVLTGGNGAQVIRLMNGLPQATSTEVLTGVTVRTVAFAPDGKSFVTGSRIGLQRWRTADGTPIGAPLRIELVQAAGFSLDGTLLATGGFDGATRIWRLHDSPPPTIDVEERNEIVSAAFSADGRIVLSGAMDGTVKTWNIAERKAEGSPIRQNAPAHAIAFGPSVPLTVLAASGTTKVQEWSLAEGTPAAKPIRTSSTPSALSVTRDGTIAVVGENGTVDLVTGKSQISLKPFGDNTRAVDALTRPFRAALAPDGETLAVTDPNGQVILGRISMLSGFSPLPISLFPTLRFESTNSGRIGAIGFRFDQKSFLVFNDKLVYRYVFDGKSARADSVHLIPYPVRAVHFPTDCADCYQVAMLAAGNGLVVQRLTWTLSDVQPIQGDLSQLKREWENKLSLRATADGKFESLSPQ